MQQQNQKESLIFLIKSKIILNKANVDALTSDNIVVVFNTESIYHYYKNPIYRKYIEDCTHLALDGVGLKIVLSFFKLKIDRFHGPDLLTKILSLRALWGITVAGGDNVENERLVKNKIFFSSIEVPFSNNISAIAKIIFKSYQNQNNLFNPGLLLISLGLPKQECVAAELVKLFKNSYREGESRPVIVPIGAALDFLSGKRIRSSIYWQSLGLEWLPRMIREPRMIPRILKSLLGIIFLFNDGLRAIKQGHIKLY